MTPGHDLVEGTVLLRARHYPARPGWWEIVGAEGPIQAPDDCPECLATLFRYVHHLPPMLVTPGRYFLYVARVIGAREAPGGKVQPGFDNPQLRDLARLLVLAGLEAEDAPEPLPPLDPLEGHPEAQEQRRQYIEDHPFECGGAVQGSNFRCGDRFKTARGLEQHRRRGWQHRTGVNFAATPIQRGLI